MAAYAALVSLMHIIDDLRFHPRPPIHLRKKQADSLTAKVSFLQEFLEGYNPHLNYNTEADPLQIRIADAACAAEDVIESHIVHSINNDGKKITSVGLYKGLKMVIEEMALIEKEAMEIKLETVRHTKSTPSSSIGQKSSMVGADEVLLQMKDKLTSYLPDLQIIPITGMGGSGKTTLARNIYQDRLILEHFHICAWVAISQEYSIRNILEQLLKQLDRKVSRDLREGQLGDMLHKHLYGRKYLIVLDDMWSIRAWDGVKKFLPNNTNGSRIVVTTRLSNLASQLPNSSSLKMKLLDEDGSWDLLSKTVFGEKDCPLEFEEIGKNIGKSCRGLPLSIVVVAGLLAKSTHTIEFWEYIKENLNSVVNLEDGERYLKILYMSYKQLPVHLKPCFLYMGVFPEDEMIRTSTLIRLWVAEGFIKPVSGKSMEEIAKEYLEDLIGRNLILICELGSIGKIKHCQIHDLLRDLCLREAEKERFYTVVASPASPQRIVNAETVVASPTSPQWLVNAEEERFYIVMPSSTSPGGTVKVEKEMSYNTVATPASPQRIVNAEKERFYTAVASPTSPLRIVNAAQGRRIVVSRTTSKYEAMKTLSSMPLARSLIWNLENEVLPPLNWMRLLRILKSSFSTYTTKTVSESMHQLVNSRYVNISGFRCRQSIGRFWNLQTFYCELWQSHAATFLWDMIQIRHIYSYEPMELDNDQFQGDIVLGNLQTLGPVANFKCSKEIVKRIPNIKKLDIRYTAPNIYDGYCLNNIVCLDKLESLYCSFDQIRDQSGPLYLQRLINFPNSLIKLTLKVDKGQCWGDILDKIGALPLLQKLKLFKGCFKQGQWKTTEGEFRSLKFLSLQYCEGPQVWTTTECSHFPCLERLRFYEVDQMEEIPLDFAEISTLKLIELYGCSASVVESAKRIVEEQEDLYGEEAALQVRVTLWNKNEALESLASPNFRVKCL